MGMTATERLRRMLDERGVEWMPSVFDPQHETFYSTENGVGFIVTEFPEIQRMSLACDMRITPEQAIAATLGATDANPTEAESSVTCRNVAVPDEYSDRPFTCSECGARGPMGDGTYHLASSWAMEDGTLAFADSWPVWKYCPNCGRKVVDDG